MTRRAQSIIEYAILIAVITSALTLMSLYVRRSVQAQLRLIEKQVNVEALKQN
jgi:hypothetical protein